MRQITVRQGSAGKKGTGTLLPVALDMGAEPEDLEGRVPLPPRGRTEPPLSVQPHQPGFPLFISPFLALSASPWPGRDPQAGCGPGLPISKVLSSPRGSGWSERAVRQAVEGRELGVGQVGWAEAGALSGQEAAPSLRPFNFPKIMTPVQSVCQASEDR